MNELMKFIDFLTVADAILKRPLENADFQRVAPGVWNFRKGDDPNVIWLQEHSSQPLFCVNLGIPYTFLAKAGTETPFTGDYVEQPDCEIKLRLTSEPSAKDQWWPMALEAADEVANLVSHRALAIFDSSIA